MAAFFRTAANFKLPDDSSNPVSMIAAGSGIAPFRGFWQYRQQQARAGAKVGFTLLIYGCRMESMDLLRDETSKFSRLVHTPVPRLRHMFRVCRGSWLAGFWKSPKMELLRLTATSGQVRPA
jgi:ferredoxin-NADP reductase